MATTIQLRGKYVPFLAGNGTEFSGQVHFYLGGKDRGEAIVTRSKPYELVDVTIPWHFSNGKSPAPDTTLAVEAFTIIQNAMGDWCLSPAGLAQIDVYSLMEWKKQTEKELLAFELGIFQADGVVKGQFILHELAIDPEIPIPPFDFGVDPTEAGQAIEEYVVSENNLLDSQLQPTYPALSQIRVPIYICNKNIIPGFGFALTPPSETVDEAFYLNLLKLTQQRFVGLDASLPRILGGICSFYANSCTYITDKLVMDTDSFRTRPNDVLIEFFQTSEHARNAGDCEDGALSCLLAFQDLKHGKFADSRLIEMQNLANEYIGCITLAGVTSPALLETMATAEGVIQDASGIAGAHMFCMLYPKSVFESFLDTTASRELSPVLKQRSEKNQDFPVLVLEPTGLLEPTGIADPTSAVRASIFGATSEISPLAVKAAEGAFVDARIMAYQSRQQKSEFYRACHSLYTPEFLNAIEPVPPHAHFIYLDRMKKTYGVDYEPVVIGDARHVALYTAPTPSPVLLKAVQSALLQGYPIPTLHPAPLEGTQVELQSKLESIVENGNRNGVAPAGVPFDIYLRYDQLNPARIRALRHFMHIASASLGHVEVKEEAIRENFGGFILRFYAPKSMSPLFAKDSLNVITVGAFHFGTELRRYKEVRVKMPRRLAAPYCSIAEFEEHHPNAIGAYLDIHRHGYFDMCKEASQVIQLMKDQQLVRSNFQVNDYLFMLRHHNKLELRSR